MTVVPVVMQQPSFNASEDDVSLGNNRRMVLNFGEKEEDSYDLHK